MILFADRFTERRVSLAVVNPNSKAHTTAKPVLQRHCGNYVIYVTTSCDDGHRPLDAYEYSI